MRWAFFVRVPVFCVASAALASCGGVPTQPSVGVSKSVAPQAAHGSLLYITNVQSNDVEIYSYPDGRTVGKLTDFGKPRAECGDAQGDVWIVDAQAYQVVEYAHGGSQALAALSTPGAPDGCATSPSGNDVAVAGKFSGGVSLVIFHRSSRKRWRDPELYSSSSLASGAFCGYDATGNLFVDGLSSADHGSFGLVELAHHDTSLKPVSVSQTIVSPGQVQWDGKYLAIGDAGVTPSVVYQFTVSGSSATLTGSTTLTSSTSVQGFWIDGSTIVGPDNGKDVGFWTYPAGGSPVKTLKVPAFGAVVSN